MGHDSGEHKVDLGDRDSIRSSFEAVGGFDALVSAAGQAGFAPLGDLADEQIDLSLHNKLRGQVELVRLGLEHVADGGSFTLTSGILAHEPIAGSAAVSIVNAGVEAFAAAAARGRRGRVHDGAGAGRPGVR